MENLIWLTANEAAKYLKVAPRTLLAWARQGKVKGHVLSGIQRQTWRFRQSDLDACLSRKPYANDDATKSQTASYTRIAIRVPGKDGINEEGGTVQNRKCCIRQET